MKREFLKFICVLFALLSAGSIPAADFDENYPGGWRAEADTVFGWDWSLPASVKPTPGTGIFNLNSSLPQNYPGLYLQQIDAKWKDLEPIEGVYDFSSITERLNDPRFDGAKLNVRGMVVSIVDEAGNPALPWEVTAPGWLVSRVPQVSEGIRREYSITNIEFAHPIVQDRLKKLIEAFGRSGIPGHPKLTLQVVHGVSATRGEEWNGIQAAKPEAVSAMKALLGAWASAYGSHAGKLAWMKETPEELFSEAVHVNGMGMRGGSIELWMRNQYTPGKSSQTGQLLRNGYLEVDENFGPIKERRAWMDENETLSRDLTELTQYNPPEYRQQNYRMANLRMLQMRRTTAWLEKNSTLNPLMLNWFSLQLGKTVVDTPDAWACLMRTWAKTGSTPTEINNLERWLTQRDTPDAMSQPVLAREHGYNVSGNSTLDPSLWRIDLARQGRRIGLALDNRFAGNSPVAVAIKVTYFDSSASTWSLRVRRKDGKVYDFPQKNTASQRVKTTTFMVDDFMANASVDGFDLELISEKGDTPFMFVRVIKTAPSTSTGTVPTPPANLIVE